MVARRWSCKRHVGYTASHLPIDCCWSPLCRYLRHVRCVLMSLLPVQHFDFGSTAAMTATIITESAIVSSGPETCEIVVILFVVLLHSRARFVRKFEELIAGPCRSLAFTRRCNLACIASRNLGACFRVAAGRAASVPRPTCPRSVLARPALRFRSPLSESAASDCGLPTFCR